MTKLFRIISKIDIKEKNLVKGLKMEGLRVLGKPENFANFYFNDGVDEIILHDIKASLYEKQTINETINHCAKSIFIPLTVCGGIRTIEDINNTLNSGADKVACNSAIIKNPKLLSNFSKVFGSSNICVNIETLDIDNNFFACSENARNKTSLNVIEWAKKCEALGAGEILISFINYDGTGKGCNFKFLDKLRENISIPIVVSGGIGKVEHIERLINIGINGAAISSMFHYKVFNKLNTKNDFSLGNLDFLNSNEKDKLYHPNMEYYTPSEVKKKLLKKKYKLRVN